MFSFQRGYPCALWQLLHTATVGMSDQSVAIEMGILIAFITQFFECKDCRDHFIEMTTTIQVQEDSGTDIGTSEAHLTSLTSRKEAVLWLWKAHNAVTARILKQESDEGANPFKSDREYTLQYAAQSTAVITNAFTSCSKYGLLSCCRLLLLWSRTTHEADLPFRDGLSSVP